MTVIFIFACISKRSYIVIKYRLVAWLGWLHNLYSSLFKEFCWCKFQFHTIYGKSYNILVLHARLSLTEVTWQLLFVNVFFHQNIEELFKSVFNSSLNIYKKGAIDYSAGLVFNVFKLVFNCHISNILAFVSNILEIVFRMRDWLGIFMLIESSKTFFENFLCGFLEVLQNLVEYQVPNTCIHWQ